MTQVTVNVTEECIMNGTKGEPESCPLALALAQYIPNRLIWVGDSEIGIDMGPDKDDLYLVMNEPLRNFIVKYDGDKRVYPFSFEVDVPEEILNGSMV